MSILCVQVIQETNMKISKLTAGLLDMLKSLADSEVEINKQIKAVHPSYQLSSKNLLRYLILRTYDLRKYHGALSDIGVSSLRSAEGYVFSNLYNVVKNLTLIQGKSFNFTTEVDIVGYTKSKKLIKKHANRLFNNVRKKNFTEIMVTLPNEAADDIEMIRQMVNSGMEIARINLSHGDMNVWEKMIKHIHQIQEENLQEIKIYMDLSGPKIRTSDIEIKNKDGKVKNAIPVKSGEHIILTSRDILGKASVFGAKKEQLEAAEIGVSLKEVITDAEVGDVILFDDGMIKSKVISKNKEELKLVITDSFKKKLGSQKGINLPDTKLNLPALTDKDIEQLSFVCQHADIIGYSFVRTKEDVAQLYSELEKYESEEIGIVFKIENREAFENLPDILLEGMKRSKIGVMIARGDLAVELGFERISEVQNQILWLCEAAHVPVIWATQVLENLAKSGIPTRAEISDAAQAAQAECVMLNKGPHINEAIKLLKQILIRMEGHAFKKKNELRALHIATNFVERFKNR